MEDPKNTAAALEASLQPDEQIEISPSTTLLQRYSAVTFNGHRIHYDRDYCLNEERYPGLLVQGPLQATFLLDLALKMNDAIAPRHFGFRATAPLFDEGAFTINGARGQHENSFWIANPHGQVTMTAVASSNAPSSGDVLRANLRRRFTIRQIVTAG